MSLSLLLEKYDVSSEEGLEKALSEIEKEELEVDEALSGVLSRSCYLEGRLRTASQAYTTLGEVKADAQAASNMVDITAALARDVSAKVRQLDLARSRVAECQRRVHDLIDLQLCSAGVEAAIKAHDYETGAAHVSRFLSMDPGSLAAARARGQPSAPDPRHDMARAANTLRDHIVRKWTFCHCKELIEHPHWSNMNKFAPVSMPPLTLTVFPSLPSLRFEEAAKKEDEAGVERLFKLFPQIGRAEEGVDLLAKYLAAQATAMVRRAGVVPSASEAAAVFADALTRVLEAGGASVDRARRATVHAPGLLPRAIHIIQPVVCAGSRRVYAAMRTARLEPTSKRGALQTEPVLMELALALSRIRLYFDFLRRKVEADAATLDEAGKNASTEAIEKIIAECDLTRTAQDMLGQYLALERYFLEESVSKALRMAAPQSGASTSSLVDDVFYIARKVIRRGVSTGSVDGACCVLNECGALLERECAAALRRWLRTAPADCLPLAAPHTRHDALAAITARLNRDLDSQRALFLAHTNSAESGAEWSERLASEAVSAADGVCRSVRELDKLSSCAAGLGAAAAAFRAGHELALAGLKASLRPRADAWADYIADPGADPDELGDESDADALPLALDALAEAARASLSARAADGLLLGVVTDIAARAEGRLLHHYYTRATGLCVERRARRLAAWAGSNAPGARERCARLAAAAGLLTLERVQHADEAQLLTLTNGKDILRRRTDFKLEDIKRLKL